MFNLRQTTLSREEGQSSRAAEVRIQLKVPYPESGQVYFYILTYDGVRLCVGDGPAIKSGSDPTRPLFAAAQDVLTELRLITEKENAQPDAPADADKPRR